MIKRLLLAMAVSVGLLSPAYSAGLYPLSNYQQFDSNGKLLSGAKLYLFDGGTTTPRIGYKDSSLTSPHPNPIVADASGRLPLVYLADGFYRQRLTTKTGTQIFDQDGIPVLSTTAGGSGTSVDPDSTYKTGDFKVSYNNQPISGYVRANGRTIGSAASGATERANSDTQPLYEKLWTFSNITVVGGKGASAVADYTANKPLALPNAAGRGIFGVDDMGAGPQNVLTGASIAFSTVVGSSGGFESLYITQSMLPSYLLTGGSGSASVSGNTGNESGSHTHNGSGTTGAMNANASHSHPYFRSNSVNINVGSSGVGVNTGEFATSTSPTNTDHGHDYAFTTGAQNQTHTHAFFGTGTATGISMLSGGGGALSPNLPPALLLMIYIRL